jgi:hypothetical protein
MAGPTGSVQLKGFSRLALEGTSDKSQEDPRKIIPKDS